ncbi:MAG: mechanosensitive ion channel family protein [Gemmatimonadota bacterium]
MGAQLDGVLGAEGVPSLIRAVLIAIIGFPTILLVSRALGRWLTRRYSAQQGLVGEKILFYTGIGILGVTLLQELGFSLAPLLGAAGIVGIALGFASQTSVSNIISGFFLMAEQPFRVGDVIRVGQTAGEVLSVDMMSVKLRTFNNEFVRIPNESLIKTEVTTVTRFPIRRLEVPVGVAYKENVERVRDILLEVADQNPLSLVEPKPLVRLERFGNSSIDLTLALWTARENWLALKTRIQEEVKARLDAEGIEIPFPHQSMYTGAATEPFPIRLVSDEEWKRRLEGEGRRKRESVGESGDAGTERGD